MSISSPPPHPTSAQNLTQPFLNTSALENEIPLLMDGQNTRTVRICQISSWTTEFPF